MNTFAITALKEKRAYIEGRVISLKKHGFKETEACITNKLSRGTFAATFFIAALVALEVDGIRLEDI